MRRLPWLLAAALLSVAPLALAQEAPADPAEDTIVVPGALVVHPDSKSTSPAMTVASEDLQLVEHSGWTSDADTTSSRTRGRASSTRVIRACEISLTLDGDCAGK